jgi:hypothetical protein
MKYRDIIENDSWCLAHATAISFHQAMVGRFRRVRFRAASLAAHREVGTASTHYFRLKRGPAHAWMDVGAQMPPLWPPLIVVVRIGYFVWQSSFNDGSGLSSPGDVIDEVRVGNCL